jgi:hypothetical protein
VQTDDAQMIHVPQSSNPQGAVIDAQQRSLQALLDHPKFFNADHMVRVDQARAVLEAFFPVRKGIYVNHRANRGDCFTVIKVDNPEWPAVSHKTKQTRYVQPLQQLGAQVVQNVRTHSLLVRVR